MEFHDGRDGWMDGWREVGIKREMGEWWWVGGWGGEGGRDSKREV